MKDMKRTAKKIASKGRHGDKYLLHISRPEMLALMASGRVTRNPKTGMPEAFNLGDFFPGGSSDPIFGGSNNFLVQAANPFSDVSRDLNIGFGPLLNLQQAEQAGFSNPFSEGPSGFDYLAGGTMAEDPEMRRIGRTVGTMFAAGALGNFAAGGGAGAAEGAAGGAAGGTGLTIGAGGETGLTAGAAGQGITAGQAGIAASGTSLGAGYFGAESIAPFTAYPEAGGTGLNPNAGGETGLLPNAAGEGLTFSTANTAGTSLGADFFGAEGSLGTGGALGAQASPGYMQQLLDYLKKRGMGKNLMTGLNLYSGIEGYMQSRKMEEMARAADPMAANRAQASADLLALQKDPTRLTSTPGYAAGEQAVMRRLASQGYIGSGNMMVALRDYGTNAYDKETARLSAIAGSPGAATQQAMQAAAAQQRSRSLASLGFTAAGLF